MAAALSAPPDVARGFAFRHSRIPRPASSSSSIIKRSDETSPKSVIADMRFVSPGSSSSGSSRIERRSLPDASSLLRKPCYNGRYGGSSSYSTSDGELSDPDSSVSTSRELNKVGNSGPLESLPETEAANTDHASKPSPCRIPLFPSANASGSEATALYVLADRTNDSGRAAAASRPVGRVPSEVKDVDRIEAALPGSASARLYTTSEGGARRREYGLRPTFSAELSSSGKPLEARPMGPGAAANFGYSGTPLRFVPGWQGPVNGARSPRVEKAPTAYNLTLSSSDVGLRHQHRFLSGPIMGSMIPKPPPSKWDDADKWIVSPNRKESPTQPQRSLQTLLTGRRHSIAGSQSVRSHASPDYVTPPGEKPMSAEFQNAFINAGKIAVLKHGGSPKKRSKALSFSDISRKSEPPRAVTSKSTSQPAAKREVRSAKSSSVAPEKKPSSTVNELPLLKHDVAEAQPPLESAADESQAAKAKEEPTKDMATQVTPVESLKNSTCTTPGLAPSPTRHCNTPAGRRASSLGSVPAGIDLLEFQGCHLAKLELRQLAGDDRAVGSLERKSVWTTREEEEILSSASLREEAERGQASSEASAWEDAERSKALVRFQSKEAKIKAWEEHQRAQAEVDMKKVEAKVERILADAAEKMQEKLASTARKAAEMRDAAESARRHDAAKAAARAELMRKADSLLSPASTASSSKVASFRSCFRVR